MITAVSVRADSEHRVEIESAGWTLVGDLRIPQSDHAVPAALLLNRAAGNRAVYAELAAQLAQRGVASLRLDLPGHGESTNLDRFVPGETDSIGLERMIWGADVDVAAAHRYLAARPEVDPERVAMVGASYSGEEMAEAGRKHGYARAYVALSPGSWGETTIAALDETPASWLFVVCRDERFLKEIAAEVQARTRQVEILYLPGTQHATGILESRPDVNERIAVWLAHQLAQPSH